MRFVEFCAGIGGFSLAAQWTGWDVIGHVEIDPWCRQVLAKHWPDSLILNDLKEVRGDEWGPVDVVAGGIPCQPFSHAGQQRGTADDRHLWPEVARILAVMQPRYCVVENVGGFVRLALDDVLADLAAQGYASGTVVLPAAGVGAPHRRDRVWIVAYAARIRAGEPHDQAHAVAGGGEAWAVSGIRSIDAAGSSHVDDAQGAGRGLRDPFDLGSAARDEHAPGHTGSAPGGAAADAARDLRRAPGDDGSAASDRSGDAANAGVNGSQGQLSGGAAPAPVLRGGGGAEAQPGMGEPDDGLPGRLAGYLDSRWHGDPMNAFGLDWEDSVPRVVTHCPDRVHKLKALGNALVPQVAYQLFLAIEGAS